MTVQTKIADHWVVVLVKENVVELQVAARERG